jgi:hypothetical protein
MFSKIGDYFSTAIDTVSETLSNWSSTISLPSLSIGEMFTSSWGESNLTSVTHEQSACSSNESISDRSFGVGDAWGTLNDNQVFAEASSAFPSSDFSSSFDSASSCGSGFDSSSSFSSSSSSWD